LDEEEEVEEGPALADVDNFDGKVKPRVSIESADFDNGEDRGGGEFSVRAS